jgi:hypothetical protein
MKRSSAVLVTITTMALGLTGCGRKPSPLDPDILPPNRLPEAFRATLPTYKSGPNVAGEIPPLNAYDAFLGYYHAPCLRWFPYPYDHYDQRWGYYRCGKWSRYNSSRSHYHSSNGLRALGNSGSMLGNGSDLVGAAFAGGPNQVNVNGGSSTGKIPPPLPGGGTPPPLPDDYATQPSTAPKHSGVEHSRSSVTRSTRAGFGATGRSSGSFGSGS